MIGLDFEARNWDEYDKTIEQKEREILAKMGVKVPEDHMDGYRYKPTKKIVFRHPWEVVPTPTCIPNCRSDNWHHKEVKFEIGQGIAYITLNRPEANNALNDQMAQALQEAAIELSHRTDIRVVVLKAEGKMFCAGGDPKSFADAEAMTEADNKKAAISFMKFLYFFQCLPQFTICQIQGSVMGSGLGLVVACDASVAVSRARFTASEVKLGTVPATMAPFISQKMGAAATKRLLCTAENLTAEMAMKSGLIQMVVEEHGDFSEVISDFCLRIVLAAPIAAGRSKRLVQNGGRQPLSVKLMEYTASELASIRTAEEAVKGMVAVQARTKPYWAEQPIVPMY